MTTRRSPIPPAALAMHMAILATSGAGKTVTAKGAVEDLLAAGERTAIIDPTGVWHGLRTLADGKPGFPEEEATPVTSSSRRTSPKSASKSAEPRESVVTEAQMKGIIYLTSDNSSGSYLLMQRAIPPQPRGGCYAG